MTNKTSIQNLKLGIFVVLGTLLILVASYLIGNRQNMFVKNFTVNAVFNNVNGLQVGNNVRFSGINIGTVDKIDMMNDTTIVVQMKVEKKMREHIRKNAIATIGSDGLVGSMLVNIVPGVGEAASVMEGDRLESYSRISSQNMLNTLSVTNENAALLTSDLLKVTQSLMDGRGTLGRLLNDTKMGDDLKQIMSNLKYSSQKMNRTMDELQRMVQGAQSDQTISGMLLSDSVSAKKLNTILINMDSTSAQINKTAQTLNQWVGEMKNGKGALQYAIQDTVLTSQFMRTMKNIEEGTEKFNENMEALKHNFLTRGYFRRLEKEQKKANENRN
ncbi:MlaD family protein [Flagellimonas sediminis]|uniref:MCE family protein n=1 Tax=Flagellimonas sediminis TaxID=2696468 RepID=A0A6I5KTZ3_9FLAO|nr:MlaD family protein [Allomuricauda sediminis]NDV44117.1 MCE family protein [Allomuricauda sediminis]